MSQYLCYGNLDARLFLNLKELRPVPGYFELRWRGCLVFLSRMNNESLVAAKIGVEVLDVVSADLLNRHLDGDVMMR